MNLPPVYHYLSICMSVSFYLSASLSIYLSMSVYYISTVLERFSENIQLKVVPSDIYDDLAIYSIYMIC